jgi:hypothetical protein
MPDPSSQKLCKHGHVKDGMNVRGPYCKICSSSAYLRWANANPDRVRTRDRKRLSDSSTRHEKTMSNINTKLIRAYGITLQQAQQILEDQGGTCSICRTSLEFGAKIYKHRACVDHCHSTGAFRGILCHYCNTALGYLKDDIEIFSSAIKYIIETKEKIASGSIEN